MFKSNIIFTHWMMSDLNSEPVSPLTSFITLESSQTYHLSSSSTLAMNHRDIFYFIHMNYLLHPLLICIFIT